MAKKVDTLLDARLHVLYCGVTMSGKTTLAREHARILARAGHEVAIYDPVGTSTAGGDWPVDEGVLRFDNDSKFIDWVCRVRGTEDRPWFVFVDESADIFGHGHSENEWLPRRVRHQEVYLRLVSQRPKMLPPNVRTQCAHGYIFRLASDDARMIAADFGHGAEVANESLDTGDYLMLVSGSASIDRGNVFDQVD